MHFLRDKMMKGEPRFSLTTRTDANGICHKKHHIIRQAVYVLFRQLVLTYTDKITL